MLRAARSDGRRRSPLLRRGLPGHEPGSGTLSHVAEGQVILQPASSGEAAASVPFTSCVTLKRSSGSLPFDWALPTKSVVMSWCVFSWKNGGLGIRPTSGGSFMPPSAFAILTAFSDLASFAARAQLQIDV